MKKLLILALLLAAPMAYAADKYACCNYEETPLHGLYTNLSRVEFFGGVSFLNKHWSENNQTLEIGDTGFTGGIAFVRNILPFLTLGLDGNYTGFSTGGLFTTGGGQDVKYRSGTATALVTGRVYLFPRSMTRLYGTGGVGAGYMYAREKNQTTGDRTIYDSTDFAWMLGAGLEFDIDETVVFGAEGRYNWVGLRSDMKDRFGHDNFTYWTVMLKLGVKF
ncbi:MAG: porin family protein [Elusimicrobiaceae bacterium]|nr:porin family protein [Elusimicrobiaceae bacterium]